MSVTASASARWRADRAASTAVAAEVIFQGPSARPSAVELWKDRQPAWSSESLITPEPWVADALCAQTDPEMFFPEKGGSTAQAKAVCAACDVREQCLEFALRTREQHGIWGGVSARDRGRMKRAEGVSRG